MAQPRGAFVFAAFLIRKRVGLTGLGMPTDKGCTALRQLPAWPPAARLAHHRRPAGVQPQPVQEVVRRGRAAGEAVAPDGGKALRELALCGAEGVVRRRRGAEQGLAPRAERAAGRAEERRLPGADGVRVPVVRRVGEQRLPPAAGHGIN